MSEVTSSAQNFSSSKLLGASAWDLKSSEATLGGCWGQSRNDHEQRPRENLSRSLGDILDHALQQVLLHVNCSQCRTQIVAKRVRSVPALPRSNSAPTL
jgi:hypothetical protein